MDSLRRLFRRGSPSTPSSTPSNTSDMFSTPVDGQSTSSLVKQGYGLKPTFASSDMISTSPKEPKSHHLHHVHKKSHKIHKHRHHGKHRGETPLESRSTSSLVKQVQNGGYRFKPTFASTSLYNRTTSSLKNELENGYRVPKKLREFDYMPSSIIQSPGQCEYGKVMAMDKYGDPVCVVENSHSHSSKQLRSALMK